MKLGLGASVWVFGGVLCARLSGASAAPSPWEQIMGREPQIWSDPHGRFSLDLPAGWTVEAKDDRGPVDFWRLDEDHGQRARVSVALRSVPAKTKLQHFGIRLADDVKRVAKNVVVVEERRIDVAGVPAIRRIFTHQELGNATRTNEVAQIVFIVGEKAFIITLESAAGARGLFWDDFNLMVKGFRIGSSRHEKNTARRKSGEGRRKVREGEMVDPEAIPY